MGGSFRSGGIRRRFCGGLQQPAGGRNANAAAGYRASNGDAHAGTHRHARPYRNANPGTDCHSCAHCDARAGTYCHTRPYRHAGAGTHRYTRAYRYTGPGYSFQQPGQLPKRWLLRAVEPRRPHHRSGLAGY